MSLAVIERAADYAEIVIKDEPRPLMRELPPASAFPVDAMGSVLANAVHAIHDKVQAPMAACGQAVLAVATLATQQRANVELPMGQIKPLSCYYMTTLETGGRKTACDMEALKPIRDYEDILRNEYEAAYATYAIAKDAYDASYESVKKKHKGNRNELENSLHMLGEPPMPPPHYMLTSTEPTFEGLCQHFTIGYSSLGIFATEGGQFIGGHSMNQEAKLRTATALSNLWDGEAIRRVRKGDGVQELKDKRLAIHLQVQPAIASDMLADDMLLAQGLLSRFLITAPDSLAGTRMWKEPDPNTDIMLKKYHQHILSIMQRPASYDIKTLKLSAHARQLWISYANSVEADLRPGGVLETIAGLANKLPEHAARLAGVLALIDNLETQEVSHSHLAAGIQLAQHYASEALRLFGASKIDSNLLIAQRLYSWLSNAWLKQEPSGLVSLPDIYQRAPIASIRDKKSAERIVELLEAHGYLNPYGPAEISGCARRETWKIYLGGNA